MNVLDDLKLIHHRDSQDALGIASKQWQQLLHEFPSLNLNSGFHNIVFSGMGGSALAARLARTWPGFSVPFEVVCDYHIPSYVGPDTLFIAASYSGNTEETIESLEHAAGSGAQIVVIAGGGKLIDIATEKGYQHLILPKAAQPRFAVLYAFKALVGILSGVGQLPKEEAEASLKKTAEFLAICSKNWSLEVPAAQNHAKKLAMEMIGKSVVIYAGPKLSPAEYKWKISFNENAKQIAWCNTYSEFNHNEFIGWSGQPLEKPYVVVHLLSSFEHPKIAKRMEISAKLLSGKMPHPHTIFADGETMLEQLLYIVMLGDFVTLYTAILNGIDPSPVDLVERLKKEL